jgi:MarR family transcriptional regulator, 2-MHQ and catechol-resistance regulon repressor
MFAYARQNLKDLGLGESEFGVLEVLLHKGPLPVNTVGPLVYLTSGSISVAIDRLEERGLVRRQADIADRRKTLACLTPQGRRLIERAFERHAETMEQAFDGFTASERSQLLQLLRRLGKSAEAKLASNG